MKTGRRQQTQRAITFLDTCEMDYKLYLYNFLQDFDQFWNKRFAIIFFELYISDKKLNNREIQDKYNFADSTMSDFIKRINEFAESKHSKGHGSTAIPVASKLLYDYFNTMKDGEIKRKTKGEKKNDF